MVYMMPIPAMSPMFNMIDRMVSNGEPVGGYHWIDNHGDDTGRGEDAEQAYVSVGLPVPHRGRGFSRRGLSG